jgi:predicted DNA-binding protein
MPDPLTEDLKVRVSKRMKERLLTIAEHHGGAAKVSYVIRLALERYLAAEAPESPPRKRKT